MRGRNYSSIEEFRDACENHRTELNPFNVLGKIYSTKQLQDIATQCGIAQVVADTRTASSRQGRGKRYIAAETIAEFCSAEQIGKTLSQLDHELYYPFLTYFRFPGSESFSSVDKFLALLRLRNIYYDFGSATFFNGITDPSSRACKLESMRVYDDDDIVSLLFSCTRILVIPDGDRNFRDFFLARIPVTVRYLFRHRLVEIAMPAFSEPAGASPNSDNKIPARYQSVIRNVWGELQQILPFELRAINFAKVTLYLEAQLKAVDMGWKIEPQEEAEFDLTQASVPLRKILDNFSRELRNECLKRDLNYPLSKVNLYKVFRALQGQSYTHSLVLQSPIGPRGGNYLMSTLYGAPNSGYSPVICIPKNCSGIAEPMRDVVNESQSANISNPYDLDKLFEAAG